MLIFIKNLAIALLSGVEICMFLRAIMSWLPFDSGKFEEFLYTITEPFVTPVRGFLEKFESVKNAPIDISFFATLIIISIIQAILAP